MQVFLAAIPYVPDAKASRSVLDRTAPCTSRDGVVLCLFRPGTGNINGASGEPQLVARSVRASVPGRKMAGHVHQRIVVFVVCNVRNSTTARYISSETACLVELEHSASL